MSKIIEIINNKWTLQIDLQGGRIFCLKYLDKEVLGTFERIDSKCGNTHVCVPNFGDEGEERGLFFHGPFRNLEWNSKLEYKIPYNSNPSSLRNTSIDREALVIWCKNDGLRVEQIFEIGKDFSHKIIVKNIENVDQIVNIASHNYWTVDNNWSDTKIDGKIVDEIIKNDQWMGAKEKQVLEFDNKKINWKLIGYKKLRLWTGRKEENGKKIFDQKYICMEPAINIEGNILKAGESREVEQKIDFL